MVYFIDPLHGITGFQIQQGTVLILAKPLPAAPRSQTPVLQHSKICMTDRYSLRGFCAVDVARDCVRLYSLAKWLPITSGLCGSIASAAKRVVIWGYSYVNHRKQEYFLLTIFTTPGQWVRHILGARNWEIRSLWLSQRDEREAQAAGSNLHNSQAPGNLQPFGLSQNNPNHRQIYHRLLYSLLPEDAWREAAEHVMRDFSGKITLEGSLLDKIHEPEQSSKHGQFA